MDVSAMMEALWGPRREGDAGHTTGRATDGEAGQAHERRPVAMTTPSVEAGHSASDHEDVSDLRQEFNVLRAELAAVEVRLSDQMADLVAKMSALAGDAPAVPDEGLASVRAELAGMQSRLDAALADRSGSNELGDAVAAALGAIEGKVVTPADHAQLRADLEFQMVEQLRLVLQEALQAVDAQATAMGAELNARLDGSVSKEDFVALRSELKQVLTANMSSAQAALQQRVAEIDATLADVKARLGVRLEQMATLVATEAAAAAERATLAALPWRSPGT